MSYILDALKKSAEERSRTQAQEPLPGDLHVGPEKDRLQPRIMLTSVVLLFCLIVGGFSFWYYQADPPPKPDTAGYSVAGKTGPDDHSKSAPDQVVTPAIETVGPLNTSTPPSPPLTTQPPTTSPASQESAPVPLLKELPLATQAFIPDIHFSGHVYSSEPNLRMIMANSSIVREHDLVAPETRLEEITVTGVILTFRELRFRIELLPPL